MSEFIERAEKINMSSLSVVGVLNLIENSLREYIESHDWLEIGKDLVFAVVCFKFLCFVHHSFQIYGYIGWIGELYRCWSKALFKMLLNSPLLRKFVDKEVKNVVNTIEKDIIKNDSSLTDYDTLPMDGLTESEVLSELDKLQTSLPYSHWEDGKVSGAVYHGGDDLIRLQSEAFQKFCVANQLHPDVFPGVRKMEAEVVAMTLDLFNAPEDTGCGTTTSGGTESLLLACLSAKMFAYNNRGVTSPEMIVPSTAHAGFNKAAYYFGIKMLHVDVDPVTFQVDLKQVKRLINGNTILLVGSAPNFPHGIVDDIEGLGKLGERYKIPVHVDCCLGSFVVAFMEKAGFEDMPLFDFRVPGVTSISCDTHKYGFAPKGSSIIMYRNSELRMNQYFVTADWVGGLYGSPTLAGSRPGALVVGCWATMVNIGQNGYIESCQEIINAARKLKNHIKNNLPALQVVGDPKCSVISFKSDTIDVHELGDKLSKKGWHLSSLQKPAALHLAVTKLSVASMDEFIALLDELVKEMEQNPDAKPAAIGTSALYGVAGSVKSTGIADKLIVSFLDSLYKLRPTE